MCRRVALLHGTNDHSTVSQLVLLSCSVLSDSVTPWTGARRAPLSMGFSRPEGWGGLPCPPSGDLPRPGRGPESPGLAAGFFTTESPGKPPLAHRLHTGVLLLTSFFFFRASQAVLVVKTLPAARGDVRDAGSIPGSGRSPGGGHGHLLQCSCPENPMDRGACWATVRGVPESQIRLKPLSTAATF